MRHEGENRIRFNKGRQKEFLKICSSKIGSLRKLSTLINIPFGYFWYYLNEDVTLPSSIFNKLVPISGLTENEIGKNYVKDVLPHNWGKIKGSIRANNIIREKLEDPVYRKRWYRKYVKLGKMMKGRMVDNWEIGFRKIGRRKTIGPRGEKMFNIGEKKISEFLLSKGLDYVYEPKVNFNGKVYFPDFVSGNLLIERFGMVRPFYIKHSKEKIRKYLKFWNGNILVFVPQRNLKTFKQILPKKNKKLLVVSDETLRDVPSSVASRLNDLQW